jgi:hypothetical protein
MTNIHALSGYEPTISESKRSRPMPQTARPLGPACRYFKTWLPVGEISSSHGDEYGCRMESCTAWSGKCRPMFQRILLPPLSVRSLIMEAVSTSETSVIYHTTCRNVPEDNHLDCYLLWAKEVHLLH